MFGYGQKTQSGSDTWYGLFASTCGSDEDEAFSIARQIRTGSVTINGQGLCLLEPFGGATQSGSGRVGGPEGILEFTEIKQILRPAAS
jgi:betaine-aldehyde dehydrogenase